MVRGGLGLVGRVGGSVPQSDSEAGCDGAARVGCRWLLLRVDLEQPAPSVVLVGRVDLVSGLASTWDIGLRVRDGGTTAL